MKTTEEIEAAILELPTDQIETLVGRLGARLQDRWDQELTADAVSGRLDGFYNSLVEENEERQDLDDFLDDQKFSQEIS